MCAWERLRERQRERMRIREARVKGREGEGERKSEIATVLYSMKTRWLSDWKLQNDKNRRRIARAQWFALNEIKLIRSRQIIAVWMVCKMSVDPFLHRHLLHSLFFFCRINEMKRTKTRARIARSFFSVWFSFYQVNRTLKTKKVLVWNETRNRLCHSYNIRIVQLYLCLLWIVCAWSALCQIPVCVCVCMAIEL